MSASRQTSKQKMSLEFKPVASHYHEQEPTKRENYRHRNCTHYPWCATSPRWSEPGSNVRMREDDIQATSGVVDQLMQEIQDL